MSLIHIPLNLYSTFLQPILQVLLPPSQSRPDGDGAAATSPPEPGSPGATLGVDGLTLDGQHAFLNISVTPLECSVVCHSALARAIFEPAVRRLPKELARTVSVSRDTYVVFSVFSAGTEAGSRVVDLTSPLALAGIPIFFITTYYSDFLLVPTKDRQRVVRALLRRGFEFSEQDSSYKAPAPSYMVHHGYARGHTYGSRSGSHSSSSNGSPPSTPPPCNTAELQARTFGLLRKHRVTPYIVPGLRLVQCSGREKGNYSHAGCHASHHHHYNYYGRASGAAHGGRHRGRDFNGPAWVESVDTRLYTALVAAVAAQPRFLSVTLAQDDPPSLLLDRALLVVFGDALVGPTAEENTLAPIFLDLEALPVEASGIVSGVAGLLVREMQVLENAVDLSYLSTARAGAVILSGEKAGRALDILKPLLIEKEEREGPRDDEEEEEEVAE